VPLLVGLVVKKGWKFVAVLRRNTDAVVAHPDLDAFAAFARCDLQRLLVRSGGCRSRRCRSTRLVRAATVQFCGRPGRHVAPDPESRYKFGP
jgi:hypothetical protein